MLSNKYTALDMLAYAFTLSPNLSQEEVHVAMRCYADKHEIKRCKETDNAIK